MKTFFSILVVLFCLVSCSQNKTSSQKSHEHEIARDTSPSVTATRSDTADPKGAHVNGRNGCVPNNDLKLDANRKFKRVKIILDNEEILGLEFTQVWKHPTGGQPTPFQKGFMPISKHRVDIWNAKMASQCISNTLYAIGICDKDFIEKYTANGVKYHYFEYGALMCGTDQIDPPIDELNCMR